jgi:mono/diheme cytochrome c family protein
MQARSISILTLVLAPAFASSVAVLAGEGAPPATVAAERVARGKYLVGFGSCHDCHTPLKMGPNGPEPDMSRALSGHPSAMGVPTSPALSGPWVWAGTGTNTAFAGPWGISFTANLTPDKETGLGAWTEQMFMMALRTGRHEGKGRPILPPMPYPYVASLTDDDLKAVFAYLQSLPPVRNKVPAPVDPEEPMR